MKYALAWTSRKMICGLAIICCAVGSASAQEASDEDLVKQTVEIYLHGLKFNDVASFKKAFNPDAKLMFVSKDGRFVELTQSHWYAGFEKAAGKEEEGKLEIVTIDVTGNAASVKVREEYARSIYTDYLALLKFRGSWKIVNKIYAAEKR